jgi:Tfp pilus assembly PilM family ATPase
VPKFSSLKNWSELPLQAANRIIAIDAGTHSIKVLLAERKHENVEVIRQEIINLQEEKLMTPEEIAASIDPILAGMGEYPIALAIPSHIPHSQVLDLSSASEGVRQLIEAETSKNRDLRDSAVVFDCSKLLPFGRHQNAFWVTLCKEGDIYKQISRLGLPLEDVCEVLSSPAALSIAYRKSRTANQQAVLVDIGATTTLVTIIFAGQAVHAATIPIAGNMVTEAISSAKGIGIEAAEQLKHGKNLLVGADALSSVCNIIDGWRTEVEKILSDWLRDNPEVASKTSAFEYVLSGGGSTQGGLIEYLNQRDGTKYVPWPNSAETQPTAESDRFAIARGTAWHVLGRTPEAGSLLPTALRAAWNRNRIHQRFLTVAAFLVFLGFIALAFGTWQKLSLIANKKDIVTQADLALHEAEVIDGVERELFQKYEHVRPVLKSQQQTIEMLNTLSLLEKSRTNRGLWYVLFADYDSYTAGRTRIVTNALSDSTGPRNAFVAELCLQQEGESMRSTLGQVVSELKQASMFRSVDTLPVDSRKDIANSKVLIPDRHFALSLELADDSFQKPIAPSVGTNMIGAQPTPAGRQEQPISTTTKL